MGIIEELASLRASVESLSRAVGRHSRVPEQRWATVTTCTASDLRVTFPGTSGAAIITRSTEAVWLGAQVLVQVQGNDRWIIGLGGGSVPAGSSVMFSGPTVPSGWLPEDGAAYSRATYWRLFAALGGASSPYGLGDGSTTFNVPNSLGRTWIGTGTATGAAGATAHTLGQKAGEEAHTMTQAELAAHIHSQYGFTFKWGIAPGGGPVYANGAPATAGNPPSNYLVTDQFLWDRTGTTGSSSPFNVMPPYVAKVPIIKY